MDSDHSRLPDCALPARAWSNLNPAALSATAEYGGHSARRSLAQRVKQRGRQTASSAPRWAREHAHRLGGAADSPHTHSRGTGSAPASVTPVHRPSAACRPSSMSLALAAESCLHPGSGGASRPRCLCGGGIAARIGPRDATTLASHLSHISFAAPEPVPRRPIRAIASAGRPADHLSTSDRLGDAARHPTTRSVRQSTISNISECLTQMAHARPEQLRVRIKTSLSPPSPHSDDTIPRHLSSHLRHSIGAQPASHAVLWVSCLLHEPLCSGKRAGAHRLIWFHGR